MTALTERITEVLRQHTWGIFRDDAGFAHSGCTCKEMPVPQDHPAHVAQRVAEALQLDSLETARKAFITLTEAWAELRMDTEHDQLLHDRLLEISRNAANLVPDCSATEGQP